jgi:sodium/proline symporter
VLGYTLVELWLFLYYAPRLRRFSEKYDSITVSDFFVSRFNDRKNTLRVLVAIVILIFMLSYVSAQFVGGGKAFAASFGIDPVLGVVITALIVLIYTILGGFFAVSLTDVVQAFFMIFALVLLPLMAAFDAGGFHEVVNQLSQAPDGFLSPVALSAGVMIGFLGIGLGSPGNPHIISRYMSIKNPDDLKFSAFVGTFWNIVMAAGAILIGITGRVYFPEIESLPLADTENLFPALAEKHLHPVIFGFVIASVFAAIMSTADSQLLVGASCIVRDIYEKVLRAGKQIAQKKLVVLSRITIFFLVLVALLLGFIADDLVFWLVLFAWAGLGAALGPTTILALFWEKTTKTGVIAGILTGTVVTIVWRLTPDLKASMYELVPAFFLSLLVTIVVSNFSNDQNPDKDL